MGQKATRFIIEEVFDVDKNYMRVVFKHKLGQQLLEEGYGLRKYKYASSNFVKILRGTKIFKFL